MTHTVLMSWFFSSGLQPISYMVHWAHPSSHPKDISIYSAVFVGSTDMSKRRWTESSRSTDPHVIRATCDGQTDQCAKRMVCHRHRKSTSSSLLQQQGPPWPSAWRQELLCASPRKPIWHLSSTVSRHTCQGVQSATRKEPDRTLVS